MCFIDTERCNNTQWLHYLNIPRCRYYHITVKSFSLSNKVPSQASVNTCFACHDKSSFKLVVDWARSLQGWVKIESLQKNVFEPGRVTAQRVILLLPSLINNIYFVICIELIQSYLRLTSHSVTLSTSGWHLTLSAHRRTAGIFIHVYATFSNYSTSCHSHFPGPSYPWLLALEQTPGRALDPPLLQAIRRHWENNKSHSLVTCHMSQ